MRHESAAAIGQAVEQINGRAVDLPHGSVCRSCGRVWEPPAGWTDCACDREACRAWLREYDAGLRSRGAPGAA